VFVLHLGRDLLIGSTESGPLIDRKRFSGHYSCSNFEMRRWVDKNPLPVTIDGPGLEVATLARKNS